MSTAYGVYELDLETEELVARAQDEVLETPSEPKVDLPLLVAAAAAGSTIVALLDRRPPLAISHDAGRTWHEAGGGLPPGRAVAISDHDPDLVLYAARNRLYLSRDGGRFWHALAPELPEIQAVTLEPD